MTDDEGLSVPRRRQCGSGITVREVTRLRSVADQPRSAVHGERAPGQSSQPDWAARP